MPKRPNPTADDLSQVIMDLRTHLANRHCIFTSMSFLSDLHPYIWFEDMITGSTLMFALDNDFSLSALDKKIDSSRAAFLSHDPIAKLLGLDPTAALEIINAMPPTYYMNMKTT